MSVIYSYDIDSMLNIIVFRTTSIRCSLQLNCIHCKLCVIIHYKLCITSVVYKYELQNKSYQKLLDCLIVIYSFNDGCISWNSFCLCSYVMRFYICFARNNAWTLN